MINLKRWISPSSDPTRDGKPRERQSISKGSGISDQGLSGLAELEARMPPPGVETEPAFQPRYQHRRRLSEEDTAGGGLLRDAHGTQRPHYWGHRERLRKRFLTGGHEPMPDYELLELLLFNAVPKKDVKPLAKRLLAEFGDLHGVIGASEHLVCQVDGADRWVYLQLQIVGAFSQRLARSRLKDQDILSSIGETIEYLQTVMASEETEQFRILFLDNRNRLIADEQQGKGTVNHVPVYPREVAKRALELNACSIILAHNHPSGFTTPSGADITMTEAIVEACRSIDVSVFDHVIIANGDHFSFRKADLI